MRVSGRLSRHEMFRLTQFYTLTLFGEIQDTFASLHSDKNLSLGLATEVQTSHRFGVLLCVFNNALLNLLIMAKRDTRMLAFFRCRRRRVACWKHVTMRRSSYFWSFCHPMILINCHVEENKRRWPQKTRLSTNVIFRFFCIILCHSRFSTWFLQFRMQIFIRI